MQPELALAPDGAIHMVYLSGDQGAADVFHVRSSDGGLTFSTPVRVNSQEGSAIATGTIRGPHIAAGRDGRVHVAWNGSDRALPRAPVNLLTKRPGTPMLYSRSNAAGTGFEPQRNLVTRTTTLDGGGSIAADSRGGVYVVWHGQPIDGLGGEERRRVWIARSADAGATFERETAVSPEETGVCGCCALRLLVSADNHLHLLYRSATQQIHRDVYSLISRDRGTTFTASALHPWEINACPMTSTSIAQSGTGIVRAWETAGNVYFTGVGPWNQPQSPPSESTKPLQRKHPRLAVNRQGMTLLVWTDGTAWMRGGSVAWQLYGPDGRPTDVNGVRPGVPVWSFVAVIARRDGGFTVVY
ncbi:MAG: sialidase family protein [Vicinamibacterales bacterium]